MRRVREETSGGLLSSLLGGLLVVLAAASCGTEPFPSQNTEAEVVVEPRAALRPGDLHRYEFSWAVTSAGEAAVVGGAEITGDIALAGELAVEVYGEHEGEVVLGVRFTRLDQAVLAMTGHNVLPSADLLLGSEAVLLVPADGRPRELRVDPDAPPVFRTLVEGVLAHVDLSVPAASDASPTLVGPTGNGLARMRYRWSSTEEDVIERELVAYERVDALRGGPRGQWDVSGSARIEVGNDALVDAIEVSEILTLVHTEDPFEFGAQTSFTMRRSAVEPGRSLPSQWPDFVAWPAHDLFDPPDHTEADRVLARSFAEGLTTTELIIAVQSAGRGLPPPKGFMVRARGLLRGWPELARELVDVFEQGVDPVTRQLALDLLVSADTPEAQAVLVELLRGADEARDPELVGYLQHLSLLRTPTTEVASLLLELQEAGFDRGDPRLRAGALYPMGALASALLYREPPLAQQMIDTIFSELESAEDDLMVEAGIAGLGNLGRDEDADRILEHRDHPNRSVRMQVASSLRHMDVEEATDVLFEMLGDRDRDVAAMSLSVIDAYREDQRDSDRLAKMAIADTTHADLDGPVVSVLAKRGLEDPLSQQALVALRNRSQDARTRTRIERILGL